MADFMKEIVVSVILQELLSRGISFALEKPKEKVSQEEFLERIRTSVDDMEFEAPMLGLSKEGFLKSSDARVFERHADSAGKFLRDVESGCSLWHHTFCCPLVRHLLEGKTLAYEVKKQSKSVCLSLVPVIVEGRGVEVRLSYCYEDRRRTLGKYFQQHIRLRISEDTDIIGINIKCTQWLASLFKLAVEPAIGELTLLPNVHDFFQSFVSPLSFMKDDEDDFDSTWYRPEPICCNGNSNGTLANKSPIEIPEPVILIDFRCYILGPKNSWRNVKVELKGMVAPHLPCNTNGKQIYYIVYGCKTEVRNGSLQQLEEIARSDGLDYLVHEPVPKYYFLDWLSPHGYAVVKVRPAMPSPKLIKNYVWRVPKRKR